MNSAVKTAPTEFMDPQAKYSSSVEIGPSMETRASWMPPLVRYGGSELRRGFVHVTAYEHPASGELEFIEERRAHRS